MKRIKNFDIKVKKRVINLSFLLTIILVLVVVFLLIFLLIDSKKIDKYLSEYKQIKINNNIDADSICKIQNLYTDNLKYDVKFCYDGKVTIYNVIDTTSKSLNVKNVADIYTIYDYTDQTEIFYILTKEGKVYYTNEDKILHSDYSVVQLTNLKNIVAFDQLNVYDKKNLVYKKGLYAINKKGNIYLLKEIY